MAQPSLLAAAASRPREDGEGQRNRRATPVHDQGHGREDPEEGGAWVAGEGDRGRAEGEGEAVGEDDEGEVGEEEAGYVGDAQVGATVETGERLLQTVVLWDGADDVYRWAMAVVGRSGRNDFFSREQWHLP